MGRHNAEAPGRLPARWPQASLIHLKTAAAPSGILAGIEMEDFGMCDTCDPRAEKLRLLAAQFTELSEVSDGVFSTRLSRTAVELEEMAARICSACAPIDLMWGDAAPVDAEADAGLAASIVLLPV